MGENLLPNLSSYGIETQKRFSSIKEQGSFYELKTMRNSMVGLLNSIGYTANINGVEEWYSRVFFTLFQVSEGRTIKITPSIQMAAKIRRAPKPSVTFVPIDSDEMVRKRDLLHTAITGEPSYNLHSKMTYWYDLYYACVATSVYYMSMGDFKLDVMFRKDVTTLRESGLSCLKNVNLKPMENISIPYSRDLDKDLKSMFTQYPYQSPSFENGIMKVNSNGYFGSTRIDLFAMIMACVNILSWSTKPFEGGISKRMW